MISCKIHDEGISDAVEFYATSQELHELNGFIEGQEEPRPLLPCSAGSSNTRTSTGITNLSTT